MSYHPIEGSSEASSQPPLYHDHSPAVVIAGKALGVTSVVMVLVAIIVSILEVHRDWTYSLLIVNLIISLTVISFLALWYRQGHLAPNKMWFLFVTASILIFQCITTIVYVTAHKVYTSGNTVAPAFTIPTTVTMKPITKSAGLSLTEASDSVLTPPF
ncbi:hypothetical protein HOLleu_37760 [Holothuria leucospilota]|uniref:Uncharacterized protein n=1 Tax=Holothuria leucospilota TaxID=206669 RepID=A0A9Q0YPF4_HOLLE|nr:hypothetical protein HOLleu_37760 [Holothuria leucospilota]